MVSICSFWLKGANTERSHRKTEEYFGNTERYRGVTKENCGTTEGYQKILRYTTVFFGILLYHSVPPRFSSVLVRKTPYFVFMF